MRISLQSDRVRERFSFILRTVSQFIYIALVFNSTFHIYFFSICKLCKKASKYLGLWPTSSQMLTFKLQHFFE